MALLAHCFLHANHTITFLSFTYYKDSYPMLDNLRKSHDILYKGRSKLRVCFLFEIYEYLRLNRILLFY